MMVIRAFATQEHEKERFEAVNKDLTKTSLFVTA
jgi:ATP-binding cassette subfamily B protein